MSVVVVVVVVVVVRSLGLESESGELEGGSLPFDLDNFGTLTEGISLFWIRRFAKAAQRGTLTVGKEQEGSKALTRLSVSHSLHLYIFL